MKNKKGVSVVVGYVILISIVVVMGFIVATWLRSYVPADVPECPEDVSVFIKSVSCEDDQFSITIQNNGFFNINGYFLKATSSPGVKIPTVDLSNPGVGFINVPSLPPNEDFTTTVTIEGTIFDVEVTPIFIQEDEKGKKEILSCGDAKVRKAIPEVDHSASPTGKIPGCLVINI